MNFEFRSAQEVAGILGVELDTLYRYARKGRICGLKVGKAWRFAEPDIMSFLERQRRAARPASVPAPPSSPVAPRDEAKDRPLSRPAATSFAEVDAASNLLAENLRKAGIAPGDRVVVLLANSTEFVVGCFGVWKVGAVLIPLDLSLHAQTLRQTLRDCAPQAMIVDQAVAERLDVQRHSLSSVRVVYVKERNFTLPGLHGVRVESLDAVLEGKSSANVIHLDGTNPASLLPARTGLNASPMPNFGV